MTKRFSLERDGWVNGGQADEEGMAATRLRIRVGDALVTKNYSKRGGGESEAINVSVLPLAQFVATHWWQLLYEPLRPSFNQAFRIRHRLDSAMRGYAFPSLAVCSAGDEAVIMDWMLIENPYSPIDFITRVPAEPIQIDRQAVEFEFSDLIEAVLERISRTSSEHSLLRDAWDRVSASLANPDEHAYCTIAGRLGIDPYDRESLDLEAIANGLSDGLVTDLSDAVELNELTATADWLRELEPRFSLFPEICIRDFGKPAVDDVSDPAWLAGETSALMLRQHSGLRGEHPKNAVEQLLGRAVFPEGTCSQIGPRAISALIRRSGDKAHISPVARSARQRRFRASAAAYLAWTSHSNGDRAATVAQTRRQQASRAFAAELLAPKDVLVERASVSGLDSDDLEDLATDLVCPFETVMWQAHRAGIMLRGVDLPFSSKLRFA